MIKWLVLAGVVLAISCTDNKKIPEDIIQKDKMEDIFWDMVVADRYVYEFLPKPGDTAYNDTTVFKVYEKVFAVHNISRDEFLKSYKFYLSRPDITRVMFDSIAVQAQRRRAEVYQTNPKTDSAGRTKPRIDSLRKRLLKP